MTVLTKDYAKILISQQVEATSYQETTTTTVLSTTISVLGGISGAIPVITSYPTTPNRTYVTRGIRLCTTAEVAALKEYLFAGLNEPEASTALYQLLYQDWGKPLRVFTGNDYIASWYSEIGVGFHYFVGYDPTDYPTQTITTEALQKVY